MYKPIQMLFQADRYNKRLVTLSYDIVAVLVSLYVSLALRLDTTHLRLSIRDNFSLLVTMLITLGGFVRLGMYRAVLRYMVLPAIGYIFLSVIISAITFALSVFFFQADVPRSVPFIYIGIGMLLLGAPRIFFKMMYYHHYSRKKPNVFIYGAGSTGQKLAYALINGNEYHPVVFLDDDRKKEGHFIFGIKIHHSSEFQKLYKLYSPIKLLIAINNIKADSRLKLLDKIASWPIAIQSFPSIDDIATGKANLNDVIDLNITRLLGRTPVSANSDLMMKNIKNKSVMVTGAGGSIGSELCRQIIQQKPSKLIMFEISEYNLYSIDQELQTLKKFLASETRLVAILGSVQDPDFLKMTMTEQKIQTVYHAAAYKHVPIVESNVIQGIRNNIFGTLSCAQAAIASKVENFTLISTDKAVRPTNIMGASKRIAELILQALSDQQSHTIFTMVRFGNVLGSSGSVVPLFKKQIRNGGPVTVTHPDIIRYFMLINEAAQLVIQAGALGTNGQIYVLDMGKPVKILDLAKRMIHLMGMKEYINENSQQGDIEIQFTGLRPGEKLYEELLIGKNVEITKYDKIMSASEEKLSWPQMELLLNELRISCQTLNIENIKKLLVKNATGYNPDPTPDLMGENFLNQRKKIQTRTYEQLSID
ncbi:MAG: UDP-N-acetyl-alpha-D-glucosamine C6 dehydratase [Candidatus Celerinatantimonas neptuna]|nr:MAG: UDP-N-acetyl-alpha-D-glucosamine C6 dehydratase [Candidatus Celerinatantimonas neptuna]